MKHLLLILSLILLGCGGGEKKQEESDMVYICTGRYSECYHCDEDCRGLRNCRASIKEITIEEAEKRGRRPCGYCY